MQLLNSERLAWPSSELMLKLVEEPRCRFAPGLDLADAIELGLTQLIQLVNQVLLGFLPVPRPSVSRAAKAAARGDAEQEELALFSSMTQTAQKDLEELTIQNYRRLQAACFYLVQDDELWPEPAMFCCLVGADVTFV